MTDTSWLDRRIAALSYLSEDRRKGEIDQADRCPWCRVDLEHTEEEHDLAAKPKVKHDPL